MKKLTRLLIFTVILLSTTALGQNRWEKLLDFDPDDDFPYISGLAFYQGRTVVIVEGAYSLHNPIVPWDTITYIGEVKNGSLDTLFKVSPQCWDCSDMVQKIIGVSDTLFILGDFKKLNDIPIYENYNYYVKKYANDTIIPIKGSFRMQRLSTDSDTLLITGYKVINYNHPRRATLIRYYHNGVEKAYDTTLEDLSKIIWLPEIFEHDVAFLNGVAYAYNSRIEYGELGIYRYDRDSLQWYLDKKMDRYWDYGGSGAWWKYYFSMVSFKGALYVVNGYGELWKRDAGGWSVFDSVEDGKRFHSLYVFKDRLYAALGPGGRPREIRVYDGVSKVGSLWISGQVQSFGFGSDGEHLYIHGVYSVSNNGKPLSGSLFRLVTPLGVGDVEAEPVLAVYPNPSDGVVYFESVSGGETEVVLYGVSGNAITRLRFRGRAELDVSGWSPGIYLYRSGSETGKLVVY